MNPAELYFSFAGRINRAKFWGGYAGLVALSVLVYLAIVVLIGEPFTITNIEQVANENAEPDIVFNSTSMAIYIAFGILTTIMSVALMVKRCHDRNKSGWWSLLSLVPLVGFIWLIVDLGVMEGTRGPNRFGPDPLNRT